MTPQLAVALAIVLVVSVAILGPQIVRWRRGEDPLSEPMSESWGTRWCP